MRKRYPQLTTGDNAFIAAMQAAGVSDPPTKEQLDAMYRAIETRLMETVADFGVDELNQMIAAANAIRARRLA